MDPEFVPYHLFSLDSPYPDRNLCGYLGPIELMPVAPSRGSFSLKKSDPRFTKWDPVFRGKHILLVDDENSSINFLSMSLKEKGMSVTLAKSGKEVLRQLESENYIDLVLMDILLPYDDGYEVINEIRQKSEYKTIPIIAMTALSIEEDFERCLEMGADGCLTKPIRMEDLLPLMHVMFQSPDMGLF